MTTLLSRHEGERSSDGIWDFELFGVQVHLDAEEQDNWMAVTIDHNTFVRETIESALELWGFEVIEDDEIPWEVDADGTIRAWIAEVNGTGAHYPGK